jgi:hypothetical protein
VWDEIFCCWISAIRKNRRHDREEAGEYHDIGVGEI